MKYLQVPVERGEMESFEYFMETFQTPVIGVELEFSIQETRSMRTAQNLIYRNLYPTGSQYFWGIAGVSEITSDHSVTRGVEIKTPGMIPGMIMQFIPQITRRAKDGGGYCDHTAGTHYHILQPGATLDRNGATYVSGPGSPSNFWVSNLMFLAQKYLPALCFYGSKVRRYGVFRLPYLHERVAPNEPILSNIRRQPHMGKYLAITPYLSRMMGLATIKPHVEFRYLDGTLDPATIIAHAAISWGIYMKAITTPPGKAIFARSTGLEYALANLGEGDRVASNIINEKHTDEIRKIKDEMVEELENELALFHPEMPNIWANAKQGHIDEIKMLDDWGWVVKYFNNTGQDVPPEVPMFSQGEVRLRHDEDMEQEDEGDDDEW